jgi:hypothetical protein
MITSAAEDKPDVSKPKTANAHAGTLPVLAKLPTCKRKEILLLLLLLFNGDQLVDFAVCCIFCGHSSPANPVLDIGMLPTQRSSQRAAGAAESAIAFFPARSPAAHSAATAVIYPCLCPRSGHGLEASRHSSCWQACTASKGRACA